MAGSEKQAPRRTSDLSVSENLHLLPCSTDCGLDYAAMLSSETIRPFSCHYHVLIPHSQKEESLVSISVFFDDGIQVVQPHGE